MRGNKLALYLFFIVILAVIQGSDFSVFGVKPNLILAVLVALVFLDLSLPAYLFLLTAALFLIRWRPDLDISLLALFVAAVGSRLARSILPWRDGISLLVLIVGSTAVFYFIADPGFIYYQPAIFIQEVLYNTITAFVLRYGLRND